MKGLPAAMREELGIKEGDLVAYLPTDQGILISPQAVVGARLLAKMAEELKRQGVSLEELTENAERIRDDLHTELYGDEA